MQELIILSRIYWPRGGESQKNLGKTYLECPRKKKPWVILQKYYEIYYNISKANTIVLLRKNPKEAQK